jgi:hypothetical protein
LPLFFVNKFVDVVSTVVGVEAHEQLDEQLALFSVAGVAICTGTTLDVVVCVDDCAADCGDNIFMNVATTSKISVVPEVVKVAALEV